MIAARFVLAVAAAAAIVAGVLALTSRDPAPPAPRPHVAIAPATPKPRPDGHVFATRRSPQSVADSAIELGRRPDLDPLPTSAFRAPVARYRRYAGRQAGAMARSVRALQAALARGDRGAARRAWAAAYDSYVRIGAAYGALGPLDQAIDALPGAPRLGGLHRIERGLWTREPLSALRPVAARLAGDVRRLGPALRRADLPPLDYATRAHEILEDAQRDILSGRAAPWSGAGVRATADGVAATRTVIATLRGVLSGRGDVLQEVDSRLARLSASLASVHRAHGGWPRLNGLTTNERERVDGALGAALEALAGVPGALETKLPAAIPRLR